jgi:transcription elongation factor Elf1
MGAFNTLSAALVCPRCGRSSEQIVELKFGLLNQIHYRLGDECQWVPHKAPQNGGRPREENPVGGGYTECPSCGKDFFVRVRLSGNRLISAEPDLERMPYDPNKKILSRLLCPHCETEQDGEVLLFEGYQFGRFICGTCNGTGQLPLQEGVSPGGNEDYCFGKPVIPPRIQVWEVQ